MVHTSCSQPLVIGDVFGSMVLVDMDTAALGTTMLHAEYDLTLGQVGPQGEPGPTGPTGPDGMKGDKGDTGQGTSLLCFATDQTIGQDGKYIGLGQQDEFHHRASVVIPFKESH